ncbi:MULTISPECIES: DUF896 domain-containing protein [unclassified Gemella]|uniref:DUF896 domain-containing protein n=1 Tax=unclassified Gemella TaxID=2624949 RepID=UPI001C05C0B2|nr:MULTISPECIES: DUF896 domain-containing protein [unclassified Gemella]MBU0278123.1 DUF896 domain-containing protein [Gemella sp. zg-1178]QWQ38352.1 DUF896 domain-containing protein [Gemella sp. zg-570]
MEMTEIISKINYINSIKKERALSSEEQEELNKYRKMYLNNFKRNIKNILDNTKFVDENGKEIKLNKKKGNNK